MEPESIILNKISQADKNENHILFSHMWKLKKNYEMVTKGLGITGYVGGIWGRSGINMT